MITNIKTRIFPEDNYKAIYFNGKTIRIALNPDLPIKELQYPEFYDVKITNKCNGSCPYCFTPETKIGAQSIESIKSNDTISGYNENTKKHSLQVVDQLFERDYSGEIISLVLENDGIIEVTPNHKLFTLNRGWIEAKDLNLTDELLEIKKM